MSRRKKIEDSSTRDYSSFTKLGNFLDKIDNKVPDSYIRKCERNSLVLLTTQAIFTIIHTRRIVDLELYRTILRYIAALFAYQEMNKDVDNTATD